jgi:transcriptional regulator with XRE-family HTH domain
MTEHLGRRIAQLRMQQGWTQQELADRLAISRVAVSHLEAGLSVPSERTVTLLAGLFKFEPPELVAGCAYPEAKGERLPLVACRYTEAELQVELLRNDLRWLERLKERVPGRQSLALDRCQEWLDRIDALEHATHDPRERARLQGARAAVQAVYRAVLSAKQC